MVPLQWWPNLTVECPLCNPMDAVLVVDTSLVISVSHTWAKPLVGKCGIDVASGEQGFQSRV